MNYIQTHYITNNGKTCKVTGICCNAPKQTNSAGIASGKMAYNTIEVMWANAWGNPASILQKANMNEFESEDENNRATLFDATLTFRSEAKGNIPRTVSCALKDIPAVEQITSTPSSSAAIIQSAWTRLGNTTFDGVSVYLANAILTFHD